MQIYECSRKPPQKVDELLRGRSLSSELLEAFGILWILRPSESLHERSKSGGNSCDPSIAFFLYLFFEKGFLCLVLAVLELSSPDWSQTQRSTCLCLPSAGIKGMCHHCWLYMLFLITSTYNISPIPLNLTEITKLRLILCNSYPSLPLVLALHIPTTPPFPG